MSVGLIRGLCLSYPHATEQMQWGDDLVFKIGGKIFAVTPLGPQHGLVLSVKTSDERFYELTEVAGIVPAPYMARNKWIALERWDALRRSEIEELVRESYALVFAKLPKKKQAELSAASSPKSLSKKRPRKIAKKAKAGRGR